MHKTLQLIYLLPVLLLNFSCVEKKATKKEPTKIDEVSTAKADTLKFTSGIRSINQDSKGNYWFGSLREGIAIYNGKSFNYLTQIDGLADNQIQSIQEDKEGVIWISTQKGVSSYDGKDIVNHTGTEADVLRNLGSTIDRESSSNNWVKTENDLWFAAGFKEGVFRYDGQKIDYLAFPSHKILNPYDNLHAVTSISKGKKNMIWLGTYAGVFGYNGSEFTIINDETLGFDREIEPLHIRSIFEDSKGRLWIGNNGIGVLLKEGNSIVNFSREKQLIHPQSGRKGGRSPAGTLEHVFTISEDSQGNIWFGDRDAGVWKYDGETMVNYTKKDGLSNDFVLSIFEDKDQKLWFGMADGNVFKFNGNKFERQF